MAQAVGVAHRLPLGLQGPALHASSSAFINALHAASGVGAVVAFAGAVLAVAYLSGRLAPPARLEPAVAAVSA